MMGKLKNLRHMCNLETKFPTFGGIKTGSISTGVPSVKVACIFTWRLVGFTVFCFLSLTSKIDLSSAFFSRLRIPPMLTLLTFQDPTLPEN